MVALDVDGGLSDVIVKHGDFRFRRGGPKRLLRPFANGLARLDIVRADRPIGGVGRRHRVIDGDDENALLARPLDRGDDRRRVARNDQNALCSRRHERFNRGSLSLGRVGLKVAKLEAVLLGGRFRALKHFEKERVVV